jgi:hypothetical protein
MIRGPLAGIEEKMDRPPQRKWGTVATVREILWLIGDTPRQKLLPCLLCEPSARPSRRALVSTLLLSPSLGGFAVFKCRTYRCLRCADLTNHCNLTHTLPPGGSSQRLGEGLFAS